MKRLLFIASGPLKRPVKGTPLRIYYFLQQIKKEHQLFVCAQDMDDDRDIHFFRYPTDSKLNVIFYFIKLVKQNKIDVILITSELGIKLPIILKLFCRVKIVIDLHGLYFEEWYYQGLISGFKKFLYEWKGKFYLSSYDLIFTVSETLKNYYKNINSNIEVVYGGVDLKKFKRIIKSADPDIFTIGYAGNYQKYQGLDYILEAAKNIKEKKLFKFKLNLVLSGDENKMRQILKDYNLSDETVLHLNVEHTRVNKILANSDILIISRPNIKMTKYAYPSKLPEFLATGLPTIVTNVGPVAELFVNNDCCIVIDYNNISRDLENAIVILQKMSREERNNIGNKARKFVRNRLTWNSLGLNINKCIDSL